MPVRRLCRIPGEIHFRRVCGHSAYAGGDCTAPARDDLIRGTGESGEAIGTIACAVVSEDEGHIRGMAVVPRSQGSGIAGRLLLQAESYFRERKCKRISLDTTPPLKRAILVYERFGFSPSGKVQNFFGMPLMEYVKTV